MGDFYKNLSSSNMPMNQKMQKGTSIYLRQISYLEGKFSGN